MSNTLDKVLSDTLMWLGMRVESFGFIEKGILIIQEESKETGTGVAKNSLSHLTQRLGEMVASSKKSREPLPSEQSDV
jgi:hypothetical protein